MGLTNKPYGWVKNGEYVLYIDKPDSVFNYRPLYTHLVSQYKAITNTKIEPTVVSYTHPVKEQELLAEIEMLKKELAILREAQEKWT